MARVLVAFEPPEGGVPEHVSQLALGLPAFGWDVDVAGPSDSPVYGRLESAGVAVHRLQWDRGRGGPARQCRVVARLARLLRDGRYDLLHAHSTFAGVSGRVAATVAGTPACYTPHCWAFIGAALPRRLSAVALERALAPLARSVICVCDSERELARAHRLDRRARLELVYNGCEPCPRAAPSATELADWRGVGPLAVSLSALRPQKALHLLVAAAPSVLERVPDARIAIIGNGPMHAALAAQAADLGLDRDARFALLPFVGPSARYLALADVFVLPSAYEALPVGLLEAQACGVPQVATRVGGNGEVVTPETGLLVPPGDPAALVDALVALLAEPERRRALARGSRRRHRERFTTARMVEQTAAVYERALAG